MSAAVIFYDSSCVLCSTFVRFIIRHDTNSHFQFAALSSAYANSLQLPKESVVVVIDNKKLLQHYAVRYIISKLPKLRWILFFFWITPKPIQKWMYNIVAKNRKRIFGSTQCALAQEYKSRFIS